MGISSTIFYDSNDSEKQTLHRRIVPSENQFEEQQERWSVLADYMITDLRDRSGCAIRSWLQGSYKFGTQVRPARLGGEYDIDLGVYFEWAGAAEAGYYEPHELKEMVQVSLRNYRADDVIEVVEPAEVSMLQDSVYRRFPYRFARLPSGCRPGCQNAGNGRGWLGRQ